MLNEIRNRYVLRKESGHPGFQNTVILATSEDLKIMGSKIVELSTAGKGRVEFYKTDEFKSKSLGSIVFEVIDQDQLAKLQKTDFKNWIWNNTPIFTLVSIIGFAIYGVKVFIDRFVN